MRVQARAGAAAPKHIKADKAGWIKSGRRGRVKFLRGEEKLRHATLQDGNEDEDATGSGKRQPGEPKPIVHACRRRRVVCPAGAPC